MQQEPMARERGWTPVEPTAPPGARLLAYLGLGAEVAIIQGGMVLVVQAEHLTETVRLADLEQGFRRAA
jgi:hypothetical protein